ncbi:RING finger protein 145-like isoform X2 [Carcharodon carcharias]|uniref:RING finger protein 145-like isoform X2 n=1 Tax=Carcharodon carcharias TaxID=13397 RepID=UPI001B7EC40C|nr:RING finger protein 145-like isoform X2 [Carcharodon carcharias]
MSFILWNRSELGMRKCSSNISHLLSVLVLVLPLQHLVKLYLYLLTASLLYVGHQTCRNYVLRELESGYDGAVYLDLMAMQRFLSALTGQLLVSSLCSFFMKPKPCWLFSAHLLPLLARLCMVPLAMLLVLNKLAIVFTGLEVLCFLLCNMFVPYNLAKSAYREIVQESELYGVLGLGMMLWNQFAVPALFTTFWLVLFVAEMYFYLSSHNQLTASHEGLIFAFLTSVAGCCVTPYSLVGLTFTVSRLSLGLLTLCKFYLQGYSAFVNGNLMHRGVTEGVTFLLLALQTDLIDLHVLQRTFLLSIILFIILASILQSMLEITDPIVLALGASRNRSLWKHFRAVTMCLFLLVFPSFMAYRIAQFFEMDFWLLIIISSSALTSLQVTGTLFIYGLFVTEDLRREAIENLEDVIYYVNSSCRVLEFLVAVCVVAYGAVESIFGEWSWMGASVIVVHSYFNVWLRARAGWNSFFLRREAARKISSLPRASQQQLQDYADVCAICYQVMRTAVVTVCGHYYHTSCLRRWLYVQKTCPMCHQLIKPSPPPPEPPQQATEEEQAREQQQAPPGDRDANGIAAPSGGGGEGRAEAAGFGPGSGGDGRLESDLGESAASRREGRESQQRPEPDEARAPQVDGAFGVPELEEDKPGEERDLAENARGKGSPDCDKAPAEEIGLKPGTNGEHEMGTVCSESPNADQDFKLFPDLAGTPSESKESLPFSERNDPSGITLTLQDEES